MIKLILFHDIIMDCTMFRTIAFKTPKLFTILGIGLAQENENRFVKSCNRLVICLFIVNSMLILINWELTLRQQIHPLITYWIDGLVWLILIFSYALLLKAVNNKKQYLVQNWLQPLLIIIGAILLLNHTSASNELMFLRPLLAILI